MLELNKEYIVNIDSLGYEGEGVTKIDRYPIFIQGALRGETVRIQITKIKKNYAYGKLLEIIEESNERKESECPNYQSCGGCALMHSTYNGQLAFKYNRVKECIERIGGLDSNNVRQTIGMKNPYRYRNKGIFSVGLVNDEISIGFFSEKTHEIIDMDSCIIQDEDSDEVIKIIRNWMKQYSIIPANKDGMFFKDGLIRNVMIRKGYNTNELMVALITTNNKIPQKEKLIDELTTKIKNIKSIVQNINSKNSSLVFGDQFITLWGEGYISDYIGKYKFNISPLSFFQVNPIQTEILYNKVLEYANINENDIVFDAYCGTGSITLFLAEKAKKVYGVEVVEQAIENAKVNAKINGINNSEFLVGKSEEVIPKMIQQGIRPNIIVVDPPRKGCDTKLLEVIGKTNVEKIVYVSCDPGTLARDLKYLSDLGYDIGEVQPVDMFPHTKHIETVTGLRRKV